MHGLNMEMIINKIEDALRASKHRFSVAVLCSRQLGESLKNELSKKVDAKFFLPDSEAEKHVLKRILNEKNCEMILYTDYYEPTVYEIMNDGSTLVHETLKLEEYILE